MLIILPQLSNSVQQDADVAHPPYGGLWQPPQEPRVGQHQLPRAPEHPAVQELPPGEPPQPLHDVQVRGVRREEDEPHPRVRLQPPLHSIGLVRPQSVQEKVYRPPEPAVQPVQELHKLQRELPLLELLEGLHGLAAPRKGVHGSEHGHLPAGAECPDNSLPDRSVSSISLLCNNLVN